MTLALNRLCLEFLCGVPVRQCTFSDLVFDLETQEVLLKKTVNSELVLKRPLQLSYQKAFIKFLLEKLENNSQEVHDDLYSAYGRLVASPELSSKCYKHYIINNQAAISLEENINLISEGTTGLRTWQASIALSEWLLQEKYQFYNKTILELGSGIGLAGLVAVTQCQPKNYIFTDCHPSVLATLRKNIIVNCNTSCKNSHLLDDSKTLIFQEQINNSTKVTVLKLPWEDLSSRVCSNLGHIDWILAADVVYDNKIFKPLIKGLRNLAIQNLKCKILFACTERNPDTLQEFIKEIRQHFKVIETDCPKQENFVSVSDSVVRLFCMQLL
ncbi:hypothetical protein ABEB36_013398 [Hypothenemus hampei]|uniref:FAM86 N-terminal domain-containing protein n=1 Tax=Hypothenemus hampei TaxID=57062 RepID=A0ABD1E7W4_HYPHA